MTLPAPTEHGPGLPRVCPPNFTDHVFKTVQGVSLSVRVWPADPPPPPGQPAPFVVWTHGGGFIAGQHFSPLAWMDPGMRRRGYHLVSHNYRLAPQAAIDEQLDDCVDAIVWLRAHLPEILGGAATVDVDRYALCGESAGGLLVTLMALRLLRLPDQVAPRAVIDAYGVVDFYGHHHARHLQQQEAEKKETEPWTGSIPEAELQAYLRDRDPANLLADAMWWDEKDHFPADWLSARWATDLRFTPRLLLQAELHIYRSRRGVSADTMAGVIHAERFEGQDAAAALGNFIRSVSSYRALVPLDEDGDADETGLELARRYPATAFLHGDADSAVPIGQSKVMAKRLRELGVPVVEAYEPGGEHVFDDKYTSPDVPGWDRYIQPVLDFVNEHVRK